MKSREALENGMHPSRRREAAAASDVGSRLMSAWAAVLLAPTLCSGCAGSRTMQMIRTMMGSASTDY